MDELEVGDGKFAAAGCGADSVTGIEVAGGKSAQVCHHPNVC